jgi:hypothetical protein
VAIALACLVLPATAATAQKLDRADEAALALALERGKLIYAYDQAAWHGTDDLKVKMPDFAKRVGGWIVDGPADAAELVFYDRDETDPKALYIARFAGSRLVSSRLPDPAEDRSLSGERKAMIAAKKAALRALVSSDAKKCADQPMNSVVLPPQQPAGSFLVYFLTPQTDLKAVPMGGHHRVEVAADGQARAQRAFTKSCLEVPLTGERGKPAGLIVTHLLDPVPTEIHVFSSLAARLPIYVGTNGGKRLWAVEGSRIRPLPIKR